MNQPDRYSRFVLPAGADARVEYQPDTKMRAAGQFNIWLEDHTLGNLLRQQLLTNPEVVFAGYRIPHPLTPMMVVRVQTTDSSDPPNAMLSAIDHLKAEVRQLQGQLEMHAPRDPGMQQQHQQQPPGGGYGSGYGAAAQPQYGGYGGPPAAAAGRGYGGFQQGGGGGGGGYGY